LGETVEQEADCPTIDNNSVSGVDCSDKEKNRRHDHDGFHKRERLIALLDWVLGGGAFGRFMHRRSLLGCRVRVATFRATNEREGDDSAGG
jgi:hypothetical protein